MRRYDRPLTAAAICLAGLAGFVDAIGFLSLGGFFVSFMSGNSTRMGAALGMGAPAQAWLAGRLILAFVAGAMAATLIAHATQRWRKPAVMGAVTLTLLAAALGHRGIDVHVVLMLIAAAMGAENCVFLRDGEVSIGLTYMTGTLVRFAQRAAIALAGGDCWAWLPHLLLWAGFVAGVYCGARAYGALALDALWIAVAAAASLTAALTGLAARR
jgi:uncharacterized membrane protein YoaK (UPF0700 family)